MAVAIAGECWYYVGNQGFTNFNPLYVTVNEYFLGGCQTCLTEIGPCEEENITPTPTSTLTPTPTQIPEIITYRLDL